MTGKAKPLTNLYLKSPEHARKTLAKIINEFHKGLIDENRYKGIVYGISKGLIPYDKLLHEIDNNKRLELLENLIRGEGQTVIDPKELESPYAMDLKRQLLNEQRINADLQAEILSIKRQLAESQAIPKD